MVPGRLVRSLEKAREQAAYAQSPYKPEYDDRESDARSVQECSCNRNTSVFSEQVSKLEASQEKQATFKQESNAAPDASKVEPGLS